MNVWGLAVGMGCGLGALLVVSVCVRSEPPLWKTVSLYVGSPLPERGRWQQKVSAGVSALSRRDKTLWGNDRTILRLILNSGSESTVSHFRWEQVLWALMAGAITIMWIGLEQLTHKSVGPTRAPALALLATLSGGWLRLWMLRQTVEKRIGRMDQQLPAFLDLLAFSVSAGEGVIPACERVSVMVGGDVADELQTVLRHVREGQLFADALGQLQGRTESQALQRAARALRLALDRGTPVASVLRAQADDARSSHARALLTKAAKKETLMMIPVVFIILPIIVIVALYPGLTTLQFF